MARTYGYELLMDLYSCNREIITSRKKLQEYVDKLCKLIRMKKYGETLLPYFGKNCFRPRIFSCSVDRNQLHNRSFLRPLGHSLY